MIRAEKYTKISAKGQGHKTQLFLGKTTHDYAKHYSCKFLPGLQLVEHLKTATPTRLGGETIREMVWRAWTQETNSRGILVLNVPGETSLAKKLMADTM